MNSDDPIQELVVMGRMTREFDVFDKKVRMRVLNAGQRRDVLAETGNLDGVTRVYAMQVKTLARAIVSVDGTVPEYREASDNDESTKVKLVRQMENDLSRAQQPVIDVLYEKYSQIVDEQERQVKDIKKKFEKPGQGASGPPRKLPDSAGS